MTSMKWLKARRKCASPRILLRAIAEMDVMRDMLKSDGLIDEDEQKDDDPFADVLKNRNDRNTPMGAH